MSNDYLKELTEKYPALEKHFALIQVLMNNAQNKLRDAVSSITEVKEEINRLLEMEPLSDLPADFKEQLFGKILEPSEVEKNLEEK